MPVAVTTRRRRARTVAGSAWAAGKWPGSGGGPCRAEVLRSRHRFLRPAVTGRHVSPAALGERLPHGVVVGHGVEGDEVADRGVSHDDLVGHRVDERPAGGCVDVGDQGQPQGGQPGGEQRHGQDRERAVLDGGDAAQHGGVLQYLGSPGLEDPACRLGQGQHPEQVAHDVVDGDRLGAGCDPSGCDHGGQVLDELACQLPGNAAVADDDPGPDDGHRDAGRSEQLLDLAAAAQVCRQGVLCRRLALRGR